MAKATRKRKPAQAAAASPQAPAAFKPGMAMPPGSAVAVADLLNAAIRRHQSGDFAGAEAAYRDILDAAPDNPYALHLLGVSLHQQGRNDEALDLIGRAIEAMPDVADFHSNMGAVLNALDRKEAALERFRRAAELKPGLAESYSNIGAVLRDLGRTREAAENYRLAHEASPQSPKFPARLGELYLNEDHFEKAVEWLGRAAALDGDSFEVHNNLAFALEKLERIEDAAEHYRRAVELKPGSPVVNNNFAAMLVRLGRVKEAEPYFRHALESSPEDWTDLSQLAGSFFNHREYGRALKIYRELLDRTPDDWNLLHNYGVTLRMIGRLDEAETALKKAIELNPEFIEAFDGLGTLYMISNRRPQAIEYFKKSIELKPDRPEPYLNLCITLMHEHRHDEASIYAHTAISFPDVPDNRTAHPNKVFHATCDFDGVEALGDPWENLRKCQGGDFGNMLLEMLPHTETPAENAALADWHRTWYRNIVLRSIEEPLPPPEIRKGSGPLRVGILSSDLRQHSVSRFVMPLLEHYDRSKLEFYCYVPYEHEGDKVQARIRELVSEFRVMHNRTHREYAETIRADGIDVLFELNGFTKDGKLAVMGYRPAPVQVYWLGYPFTTGVADVDYIVTDPRYRPEDEAWLAETPLAMPETFCCMERMTDLPVTPTPPVARNDGMVTFGTLNNPYKITRKAVAAWARVMRRVPKSRFLIVRPEAGSMVLCRNLTEEFGRHGVTADRLYFVNNHTHKLPHFAYYEDIDIQLDTFPMTGGTTTCDSVLMGTPVVSLVGPGTHQRLSRSILHTVGLQDLCVDSVDAYVDTAVELAENPDALAFLRQNLRPMVHDSPLCDGPRFARNLEDRLHEIARQKGLR